MEQDAQAVNQIADIAQINLIWLSFVVEMEKLMLENNATQTLQDALTVSQIKDIV